MGRPLSVWFQRAHCFRTTGSTGTSGGGKTEQWYSNRVTNMAADLLRANGHEVTLGLADQFPKHTDIFWAPHCDGSVSSLARGCSTGARTTKGFVAGRIWRKQWHKRGYGGPDRSHNYTASLARYYGTGWAASVGTPIALVTEFAFMTNKQDVDFLLSADGLLAAAYSLADTVSILSGNGTIDGGSAMGNVLEVGDSGKEVRKLQQWLNTAGITVTVDGDFGPKTEAAVELFQDHTWLSAYVDRGVYDSLFTAPQLAARVEAVRNNTIEPIS